ncbi:hypothetical protein ORL88_12275 [Klebsiella oxytoca]|uniref:GREB1-related protein n=1 Tax=Klebsiella oxytoca TaxID=571 RepID=UPI0007CC4BBB|nr:hypothetical protein [Klebsiella oxytoca]MCW9590811.1 hypothetical protein [Klebsiella oxytoca]MCW9603664.1 hypothetical protein [Klebsiella oxytoca]MCW9624949.1 hypothetical protein [Klebsiella oxytoca]SAQ52970.1 Uncharacterised protein [Klebsiella oxytoca]
MNPKFPLYIVSKGRSESRLTAKTLERLQVPYFIVIEEQEYVQYSAVIDKEKILVLDKKYQHEYDTFDELGLTKSVGPGAARNFVWDHSIAGGYPWHWVMDDNIRAFYRLHKNKRLRVGDGTIFRCMEDFVLRYENVAMAGPNYYMFAPDRQKCPPFITNTRIYSCNLIRNDSPFRWRGRYNEDTDLSLRMLKAGWCTIQFNAFLQNKVATQKIKGGNTAEFYAQEGTYNKSRMQVEMHPDVSRMVFKFGRVHHHVDYSRFKSLRLRLRSDIQITDGADNYGMVLKENYTE